MISHELIIAAEWAEVMISPKQILLSPQRERLSREGRSTVQPSFVFQVTPNRYCVNSWRSKLSCFHLYLCMHAVLPLTVSTSVQLCKKEVWLLIWVFLISV